MQCGMLIAFAIFGGASLMVWSSWGGGAVIGFLIVSVLTPTPFVWLTRRFAADAAVELRAKIPLVLALRGFVHRRFLLAFGFALTAGAAFEAQGGIQGALLIDRGWTQEQVGRFQLMPLLGMKVAGALIGGWLADRFHIRPVLVAAMAGLAVLVAVQGLLENWFDQPSLAWLSIAILLASNLAIGVFIASSYALLMNQSTAGLAATQFTAFMSATNACEAWSTRAVGALHSSWGYPGALAAMSAASLIGFAFLAGMRPRDSSV
jgi:hypothetical protein